MQSTVRTHHAASGAARRSAPACQRTHAFFRLQIRERCQHENRNINRAHALRNLLHCCDDRRRSLHRRRDSLPRKDCVIDLPSGKQMFQYRRDDSARRSFEPHPRIRRPANAHRMNNANEPVFWMTPIMFQIKAWILDAAFRACCGFCGTVFL
jgi:hypothetical protein